jgi:hypothetical protein
MSLNSRELDDLSLAAERDAWKMLAEARADLLAAYRFGRGTPQGALTRIDLAKRRLLRITGKAVP